MLKNLLQSVPALNHGKVLNNDGEENAELSAELEGMANNKNKNQQK